MAVDGSSGGSSSATSDRVTEKQLMWSNGGPGVYSVDYRKVVHSTTPFPTHSGPYNTHTLDNTAYR